MKLNFVAFVLFITCLPATAQSDVATAKWKTKVTADGKLREWQQPLSFYDSDTKLFFDIANDSNYLYLCFKTVDEMSEMKLMQAGMKITLSTKEKPKREASLVYPLPAGASAQHNAVPTENSSTAYDPSVHDVASFRNNFLQHHTTMNLSGFATLNGIVPLANSSGITAALNWDSASHLVYEIAIPKAEFFGKSVTPNDEAADILLHVEVSALPRSASGTDSKNGYNSAHEKEGKEGGLGSDANRVDLTSKTSFRQKFVLSKPLAANANSLK